jgi:hypothetical protein
MHLPTNPNPDPRLARLSEAHVRPLMALIESWRLRGLDVPNVDPNDGGLFAKALFLLESPGPRAVGTRFISRDNPDPSARNFGKVLDAIGFLRADVLLWNVVPYSISTADRNQNATISQVRLAAKDTQGFLNLLPELRAVTFCGRRAQVAERYLSIKARTFRTFHPGAMAYNRPILREHIHATFKAVYDHISN